MTSVDDTVRGCIPEDEAVGTAAAVEISGDATQDIAIAPPPFSFDDNPGDKRS